MILQWTGRFRIYWNTERDRPKLWAIDDGNNLHEINVIGFNVRVPVVNGEDISAEWPKPKGWMQGVGQVQIDDVGMAHVLPISTR